MKKAILSLVAAVALAIGLTSCQHQTMETIEFSVTKGQWEDDGNLLTYTVKWNELDEDVVDYGTVNVYFIDRNGSQNILPFVYTAFYPTDDGGTVALAENITFYYGYGFLTITIEDMDGNMPARDVWGPRMTFRAVAIGD